MCRLFAFRSNRMTDIHAYLRSFAQACQNSQEYQGHGWGIYYQTLQGPKIYHALNPIWNDDLTGFEDTNYCLVHARSAFRDEGIVLSNNMPFIADRFQFVFNGELHGVKIKSEGSTGAKKLFNLFLRLTQNDTIEGLERTMRVINKKSEYIRGSNVLLGDGSKFYVYSDFNEDNSYFTLHYYVDHEQTLISSESLPLSMSWNEVETGRVISL